VLPIGATPPPEEGWRDGPFLAAREAHAGAGHKGPVSACTACMAGVLQVSLPDVVIQRGLGSGWGDSGTLR
jgi:hypothetical protein